MSLDRCSGLIDEAHVTIDTSALSGAGLMQPLVVVGGFAVLVAMAWATAALSGRARAWVALPLLLALIGAALAALAGPRGFSLWLPCLAPGLHVVRRVVTLGGAVVTAGFAQLVVSLSLRAYSKAQAQTGPAALAALGVLLAGGATAQSLRKTRAFAAELRAASPVPNVRAFEKPPTLHVGRTRFVKPVAESAGHRTRVFFFVERREALPDDARTRWGLDRVEVSADQPGDVVIPVHREVGPVSIDAEVTVRALRDEGPGELPLAVGNRWEYEATRGRGGALSRRAQALAAGKAKPGEPALTLEVVGEHEADGLHVFELTVTHGDTREDLSVVRADGELSTLDGRPLLRREANACRVGFLTPGWCDCSSGRIASCREVKGDLSEGLTRFFLAVVTVGITEIAGMGDMGAGNETGLLLTRWVVDGEGHELFASAAVTPGSRR